MITRYRITEAAQQDIIEILTWTHAQFGVQARERYEALIAAGIRDASAPGSSGTPRPDLGPGVLSWHLRRSRHNTTGDAVQRPRHFLIYRMDDDTVVIGRVLHDAMELRRHVEPGAAWQ